MYNLYICKASENAIMGKILKTQKQHFKIKHCCEHWESDLFMLNAKACAMH